MIKDTAKLVSEMEGLRTWTVNGREYDRGMDDAIALVKKHMEEEPKSLNSKIEDESLVASAKAHRAICGNECTFENKKLHGYCEVCGVPWPCDTARSFLLKPSEANARIAFLEKEKT